MTDHSERVTREDPREHTSAPATDVPNDVFMAAKDAAYGVLSYLDMEWTAHRPIQGDATPKVIAYWVAAAVCKALAAEPVVEPTKEAPTMPERIAQRIEAEFYPVHDGEDYHDGINKGLAFAARIARAHNAEPVAAPVGPTEAQVPTPAQIMAAAQALWSIEGSEDWDDIDGDIQDHYRNDARIALVAAAAVQS